MEKIVYNKLIPAKGYKAITILPFIFVRAEKKGKLLPCDYRHERIHLKQQTETFILAQVVCVCMLLAGFGWWSLAILPLYFYIYLLEWAVKLAITRNSHIAYRSISTEQEAYAFEHTEDYLSRRGNFAWVKYIFKIKR